MSRLRPKIAALALLSLLAVTILIPTASVHEAHAGDLLVPEGWRQAHPGPYAIDIAVLVDEEWADRFGEDARRKADAIVRAAARHFEPAGIKLRPIIYESWTSPDGASDIVELLDTLETARQRRDADLVVGLVAGYRGREGGAARPRLPHVVVKHHRYHPERDAYVLAHELAHVLGLHHHVCPDGRCFMADHEYDPGEHWCDDHLELLRANGGYFQYLADASA